MLQLAPRGEIAVPMDELEDLDLLNVKMHRPLLPKGRPFCLRVRRFRCKFGWRLVLRADRSEHRFSRGEGSCTLTL
jgi:hypothetical protein